MPAVNVHSLFNIACPWCDSVLFGCLFSSDLFLTSISLTLPEDIRFFHTDSSVRLHVKISLFFNMALIGVCVCVCVCACVCVCTYLHYLFSSFTVVQKNLMQHIRFYVQCIRSCVSCLCK